MITLNKTTLRILSFLVAPLTITACLASDARPSLLLTDGLECASGSDPINPNADDIETILNLLPGTLTQLYKQDVNGAESGPFAGSYTTTYSNTPNDPSDALIEWDEGQPVASAQYALVKDGNHTPAWYLFCFDESEQGAGFWDGMEDLEFEGFWPEQGSISHIAFYGEDQPSGAVPEPGSFLIWSALGMVGVITARCRFRRRASIISRTSLGHGN